MSALSTKNGTSSANYARDGKQAHPSSGYAYSMLNSAVGKRLPRRHARARVPRKYMLSPVRAAQYAAQILSMFLLASVEDFGGALALGLFAGLVYARRNMLVVAPVYALAVIAFSPSWWTVLYVSVPVLLFFVVYLVFFRLRKNVHVVFTTVTAIAGEIPHAVCTAVFGGSITAVVLSAVIVAVFSFCAQIVCYAVLLRGINTRFTPDELIAGGIIVVAFAFAAAGVSIEGFTLVFALAAFFVMLFAVCVSPATAFAFATLAGVGAAFAFQSLDFLAFAVLSAAVATGLLPFTKWASAAGVLAVYAVLWLGLGFTGSGWQNIVTTGLGLLVFLLIPKQTLSGIHNSRRKGVAAVSSIVNRNRNELAARLMSASQVFYDMSHTMTQMESAENFYTPERLASEVAKNYCGRCPDRERCFAALDGDTACVLLPMANAVMTRGKVTILDMPPFITGRCGKMYNLASVINSAGEAYRQRIDAAGGINETKRIMSEQFAGVSLVLDSLARECGERVSFGEDLQDAIGNELLRHNIVSGEIVVSGQGASVGVTLTVRACDADKLVLPRIVSAAVGARLEKVAVTPRGEDTVVHLAACPVFEVAYGVAEKRRDGEGVSGDTKSILCPSRRRRLFAVSDGMGSGEHAAGSSKAAISMVENFYRAGFDNAVILSLVNKLLCLSDDENFSSLDISVIDTVSGGLDVIKMGAASSFVCHRDNVEIVSCAAPPAGILEKAKPLTSRLQLYDGDMVIMMSDGVFDVLDEQGVIAAVEETDTQNPQILADRLLDRALAADAKDDCTVLVMRLFAV